MSPRKPKPKRKSKPHPPMHDPEVSITVESPLGKPRGLNRFAAKTGSKIYRTVETFAFIAAILQLLAYMSVEVLHRADVIHVNSTHEGFPWGTMIGSVILIAPKLVGRAFAGRALVAMAGRGGDGVSGATAEYESGKGGE